MDLHSAMNISKFADLMDLLNPEMVVNSLFYWVAVTLFGGIGVIIWKWNKAKNEKRKLNRILSSEIEDIQKELKPLANCRNKAFNEYDNISEEDKLPEEFNFYNTIYSNMGDKLELLDIKYQIKLSRYYNKIEWIKEQYKKFGRIHTNVPPILSIIELEEYSGTVGSPNFDKIIQFLIYTEDTYNCGEDLIKYLKDI